MSRIVSQDEPGDEDKKGRGRPRTVEDAEHVADTRSVLSRALRLQAISGVSGKPLTADAMACMLWWIETRRAKQCGRRNSWTPPDPVKVDLEGARKKAIASVKKKLIARSLFHVDRARRGEPVYALQMVDASSDGPYYMPAFGGPGLPGLYSCAWPTTIGLPGEATLDRAWEVVGEGNFKLLALDRKRAEAAYRRLKTRLETEEPDEAAIWEQVVKDNDALRSRKNKGWTGARKLARLVRDARTYEYQFPGMEHETGRKPLPPARN